MRSAAGGRLKVFVDTGAWIALFKQKEPGHASVAATWEELLREGTAVVTSSDVLDETCTRLRYDVGPGWALSFHRFIGQAVAQQRLVVQWVNEGITVEAWKIFEKYADQTLSLTDCTSAAICHRMKIPTVLTLDSDFRLLGFETLP